MRRVFVKGFLRPKNGKVETVRSFWKRRRRRLLKPFYRIDEKSGCWIWLRATNGRGYGVMVDDKSHRIYSHRYFYEKKYGKVPANLEIDHKCKVRSCVNPDHMEPVTHFENCIRSSTTKLTYGQVLKMRKMRKEGKTYKSIAEFFKIAESHAWETISGNRWKK